MNATRAEVCAAAVADAFRGDGEILASSFGTVPSVGARLAKLTFEPDLLMTDGSASLVEGAPPVSGKRAEPVIEAWLPFRSVFELLWSGRRHVFMVASQLDRYGNLNLAYIGDHDRPKVQLLGMRGAPGNTINHTTSYWIPRHTPRALVQNVDVVCGVGYDRAAELDPVSTRFHCIRRVITNLGVFDFETEDHRMRVRSLHPEVTLEEVVESTGFELVVADPVAVTRTPDAEELRLIREVIDPEGLLNKEVPS